MTTIPWLALYILYFTIHEKTIFDWGRIISVEISSQLSKFQERKEVLYGFLLNIFYYLFPCLQGFDYQEKGRLQN
jgi:hypothetical protein